MMSMIETVLVFVCILFAFMLFFLYCVCRFEKTIQRRGELIAASNAVSSVTIEGKPNDGKADEVVSGSDDEKDKRKVSGILPEG